MQKGKYSILKSLNVRPRPGVAAQGQLFAAGRVLRCALGRSGIGSIKREGDGKTPVGSFKLLSLYRRSDRNCFVTSRLSSQCTPPQLGWCDAVGDRNYNRPVRLPYPASCETMQRQDHLYDYCIVMDHNITRHMGVGGSAIFFHLAHDDYRPTEGCVAIARTDMEWLLPQIGPETVLVIER